MDIFETVYSIFTIHMARPLPNCPEDVIDVYYRCVPGTKVKEILGHAGERQSNNATFDDQ